MYSEQCKSCIVEGCPDSCSVKINYKRDFERIVRCKDCKYRYVDGENVRFNVCELNHNKVQPDDWYCGDAERRSDE